MSLKIDANKAKLKIDEFLSETDILLEKSYTEGKEQKYGLNTRIRNFVNMAFSDSKEKIKSYTGLIFAIAGHQKNPYEEQKDYEDCLKKKRRHLIAWKEEVELNLDTTSESTKLNKIKDQIEETGLESERRQKVAETKFFGAVIELLDFQRNLIKEKEQTTKAIIEMKKDISDIKEMLKKVSGKEEKKV